MELSTFLTIPRTEVQPVAPRTVVWAAGGTRRYAVLQGIAGDDYYAWALERQLDGAALLLDHGVRTLFMPIIGPPQIREVGHYRERLLPMQQLLISKPALLRYAALNCRVRLLGHETLPGLSDIATTLEQATANLQQATIWWVFIEDEHALVSAMLRAAVAAQASTWAEAVRAYYGEDLAPVDVFIGFGKLEAGYLLPPLLGEQADLYWAESPSYAMTEADVRRIIWDHRFARQTWMAEKNQRYAGIVDSPLPDYYARHDILGIGQTIHGFWRPQPTP